MVAPLKESNGGQREAGTADVDYASVAFRHGPSAYVMLVVVTVRGVARGPCEVGFGDRVAD